MNCRMDDGSYYALVFSFGDGTSIAIKVEARGCQGVYVGGSKQPVAWSAKSPELFDTLKGLLAHQPASCASRCRSLLPIRWWRAYD
jgi:hypothetical protein